MYIQFIVAGGWSAYGDWTTCANNERTRTRTCDNPAPAHGGAECVGDATQTEACTSNSL